MSNKPYRDPKTGRFKKLSPREKEVVNLYVSPKQNTYLNGTQSVLQSNGYNATTPGSAAAIATEILKRPHVANAVQAKLDDLNMGHEVRLERVAKIAEGYDEVIVSETTSRDGSVTTTTTTRPLSPKVQLAALQRLDKLDGSDDMRKVEARVMSDSLLRLSKQMMREKRVSGDSGGIRETGLGGEDPPPSLIIPSPSQTLNTKNWRGVFDPLEDIYA